VAEAGALALAEDDAAGPGGPAAARLEEFECEQLELWGVDEHSCRGLPACRAHVPLSR